MQNLRFRFCIYYVYFSDICIIFFRHIYHINKMYYANYTSSYNSGSRLNQPRSCRDPRLARKRDHKFARSGIQVRTNL